MFKPILLFKLPVTNNLRCQIPKKGKTSQHTTPGKQFSVSRFGPSSAAGVDPPDESEEESGDDGMELFIVPILAVIS